jgi:hypothetical protein
MFLLEAMVGGDMKLGNEDACAAGTRASPGIAESVC